MKLPKYQLTSGEELLSYEFISDGPKGLIRKRIQFTLINRDDVYNLAFGDKDTATNEMDDMAISNNGDGEKVLATVISAVYAFYDKHPGAWVFAAGTTSARTRLYRMGITKYYSEIKNDFEVYGQTEGEWELFEKDKVYSAFLCCQKIL